ncbi:FAD-dependent thymidylate synthase [Candidatus Bipolaricaulota bacterium]|nr:FAD-dependent thymidylate synthase [Candidatus Bipolaricaulota bacterium]
MQVRLLSVTPDAEALIARCARISHRSEDKASPEADRELIRKLIRWGHESPLEFAHAVFLIEGISRACANQLTRHRLASFVQESQRYVDVRDRNLVKPPTLQGELWEKASSLFSQARLLYEELVGEGIPKEDARYVLPIGTETRLVMCANFRELRHIIRLRGSRAAQWEVREVARKMLVILKEHAESVFGDLEVEA